MALSNGFKVLAQKLQEASMELSHGDLNKWLSCACAELSKQGHWCYLIDVFGDTESGDVILSMDGDLKRAPYSISQAGGKSAATIDLEVAEDVLPRTTYEPEADESDAMASIEATRDGLYSEVPAYERFIPQSERKAADSGSFAGKGKSFPILKPADVMAAVRSMGRAGPENYDIATLKRNIIRIAKAKGWAKELPKSWRGDSKEAAPADVELTGDVIPLREGAVAADGICLLKLIAPGRGSSGFYPAEVLKRDGPRVFPQGTKNFWDHPTGTQEAERPEGSLRDLASVLVEDAHFEDAGPAGAGLYARARVYEQFRKPVNDLAKDIGMSIRAAGKAREGKAPDGKSGPIIEELTRGVSVDYVTTPGAGGKVLQLFEAARKPVDPRPAESQHEGGADTDMDAAELKKLQESVSAAEAKATAAEAQNQKLAQRLALSDAAIQTTKALKEVQLPEATKQRLIARLPGMAPISDEGVLDAVKFSETIKAEVAEEAAYLGRLTEGRIVIGQGVAPDIPPDPKVMSEKLTESLKSLAGTMGITDPKAVQAFVEGRV